MKSGDLYKPKEVDLEEFYRSKLNERVKKPHVPKVEDCVRSAESLRNIARAAREGVEEEEAVHVSTKPRPAPLWSDSRRVFECEEIQDKLRENGVEVRRDAVKRALLPPPSLMRGEWSLPRNYSSGLLSCPVTWFSRG